MRKRRWLLLLTALCLSCFYFGVNTTEAWFVAGGTLGGADYETAQVRYLPSMEPTAEEKSVYGSLLPGSDTEAGIISYLVPGEEILQLAEDAQPIPLSLENFSTVATNVRVKMDCRLTGVDGTEITGMEWRRIQNTNRYQYGQYIDLYDSTGTLVRSHVFMGLLELTLYGGADYTWDYGEETPSGTPADQIGFPAYWELRVAGSDTVPPLSGGIRQQYQAVVTGHIIGDAETDAGEAEDEGVQAAFDTFFSEHYAGASMSVSLNYYAKQQEFMQWQQFTHTDLVTVIPGA